MTQGLGTILGARELVLVAQGSSKAEAVAARSSFVHGSALQLHAHAHAHAHATVVVDEEAAAGLTLADYYRAATQPPSSPPSARSPHFKR
jgi:glucosamine-6-phosphate deaminase